MGRREGEKEGLEKGRAETKEKMKRLIQILISEGRIDDLEKASKDVEFQKKLFQEFSL